MTKTIYFKVLRTKNNLKFLYIPMSSIDFKVEVPKLKLKNIRSKSCVNPKFIMKILNLIFKTNKSFM